ncbi:MAG: PP0621 family protein [Rubrivivax sp.]|nr:PP0621 family protein [Rubrivivax sp.]
MKYLLLLVVIGIAVWMFKARGRVPGPKQPPPAAKPAPGEHPVGATPMLACAHCGVHLPKTDAVLDPAGRVYCSAAHLHAGPR